LHFHGQLYGMPLEERRQRVPQVLEVVGLSAQAHDKLRTFSKGMLQRIGLAQALLHEPSIVFLDEPTSGLDPLGRRHVRDIIRGLKANEVTVFLNSHLLSEVELVCDRVAIINKGRVIRSGLLEELLSEKLELQIRVGDVTPALLQGLAKFGSSLTIETTYDRVPVSEEASPARWEELSQLCNSIATDGTLLTLRLEDADKVPLIAEAVVINQGKLYNLSYRHVSLEELFIEAVGEEG
jgi:ABC-2 type transport system ATP-binding protein